MIVAIMKMGATNGGSGMVVVEIAKARCGGGGMVEATIVRCGGGDGGNTIAISNLILFKF